MPLALHCSSTEWVTIFITCAFLIIPVPTYRLLFHPLAVLPGPKLAALSSWWQIRKIIAGKPYELALHDRYGPIVRTAPNEVVINILFLIKLNLIDFDAESSTSLDKGPWYDMMRYQLIRRSAGPAFTASNLKRFKPKVIEVMQKVCERLHRLNGEEVDTSEWMHIIVLENILEQGHNHGDLELNLTFWRRTSVLGHLPTLRVLLDIIPMLRKHIFQILDLPTSYSSQGIGLPAHIGPSLFKQLLHRISSIENPSFENGRDLIEQLLAIHIDKPKFDLDYARGIAGSCVAAGHDTTGSSLVSILCRICTSPDLQRRVEQECRGERVPVGFEDRPSTITSACVREAMRLHHVTNFSLSRVAPRDGLQLHGYFLPEGTVLGCNPTTFARNTDLFGPDAREFKPERWLSGDEDHIKTMERYNLLFGGQSRSCPGQNLAKLIISSVVPRLFRNFDIQVKVPGGGFDNYPPQFWTMLSGSKIRFVSR
ncbi:cytochrome P450 [Trichoderma asperelloides]|nr:cytochrome P450 [Trichoderma asperelloides]